MLVNCQGLPLGSNEEEAGDLLARNLRVSSTTSPATHLGPTEDHLSYFEPDAGKVIR